MTVYTSARRSVRQDRMMPSSASPAQVSCHSAQSSMPRLDGSPCGNEGREFGRRNQSACHVQSSSRVTSYSITRTRIGSDHVGVAQADCRANHAEASRRNRVRRPIPRPWPPRATPGPFWPRKPHSAADSPTWSSGLRMRAPACLSGSLQTNRSNESLREVEHAP